MTKDMKKKIILIRPARSCNKGMSDQEIYEMTRGVWRVSIVNAQKVEYAFCVIKGEIIRIYKIHQWHPAGTLEYKYRSKEEVNVEGRWEFEGERCEQLEKEYSGISIASYFSKGNQNPIRYINCD